MEPTKRFGGIPTPRRKAIKLAPHATPVSMGATKDRPGASVAQTSPIVSTAEVAEDFSFTPLLHHFTL
jgi:hypothetical protein